MTVVTAADFDRYLWATSLAVDAGHQAAPLGGNRFSTDAPASVFGVAVAVGAVALSDVPAEPPPAKRTRRNKT